MTRELKILPGHFDAIDQGFQRAIVRQDDLSLRQWDVIVLHEFDPVRQQYTDRQISMVITHALRSPVPGLQADHCVLSITPLCDMQGDGQ